MKLIHYDPYKPAANETDASLKGLGAVLIQDGKPVCFLSKALTPAKAQLFQYKEGTTGSLICLRKDHTCTFGWKITLHMDHKPLQSIFLKPISLAPARLQRMLLCLSKYDLQVKYVRLKTVRLADTLSSNAPDKSLV